MKSIKILFLFLLLFCIPQLQIDSEAQITMKKCSVCGKPVSNCAYKGNHPKCGVCGKVKENCPYRGNHPKCSTCGKLKEQCQFNGSHPAQIQKETFTVKGISFVMVKVEGGTFQMGSADGDSDEKPVHQVTLDSYYIGETEVTQALWEAVMGSNPSRFKGSTLPVEQVSWNDCQTFISKLNSLTGKSFRLPTEAEWEYAARGGSSSHGYKYSGSNNIDDVAWYMDDSGSSTHLVKTKKANELGIYDMSGNVWEWCQDWKGSYSSSSQTNPSGPSSGSLRVLRGGGRYNSATSCRCADRSGNAPTHSSRYLGLRLALSAE